jgi:hypothetical protein
MTWNRRLPIAIDMLCGVRCLKITVEIQMLRTPTLVPIAAVAFLLSAGVSFAAERGPPLCAADFKAFCTDVEPGEGRLAACVKEHLGDFSITCKVRLVRAIVTSKECVDRGPHMAVGGAWSAERRANSHERPSSNGDLG